MDIPKVDLAPILGPSSLPVIGNLLDLTEGTQSIFKLAKKYNGIFQVTLRGNKMIFITKFALFDELCDQSLFHKTVVGDLKELRAGVKDGLFTAHDGEHGWGVAHRIIMPVFGPLKIRATFPGMKEIAQQLTLKWARYGPDHRIDIAGDLTRLTLDTIALCSMGYRFNSFYRESDVHPFIKHMFRYLKEAENISMIPGVINNTFRQTAKDNFKKNIAYMRELSRTIIDSRRQNPSGGDDLLNALLHGRDPKTGEGMSDDSIINNLITFLIAGHETTSGALSFVFYYLLKNPKTLATAREEVDRVIGSETITVEHLSRLPYVDAVFREALRLRPTAPAMTVTARQDTVIGGKYAIKKGEPMTCMFQSIQQDPEIWGEDAAEWRPERMLQENFEKLPKNAWKPFGNGARGCIGRAFAWQESQLVIAMILQNFDLSLDDPQYKMEIVESLTIKPGNLYVRARLRNGRTASELNESLNSTGSAPTSIFSGEGDAEESTSDILNGTPMTILYGSNSGTCEALAHRLAKDARNYGHIASKVATLDSAVGGLPSANKELVVIVTASYDGQPADNATKFFDWLKSLDKGALHGMPFAVFGCGHQDWASTFYKVPMVIDELLAQAGGVRVAPMGKANAATSDMFSDLENWEDKELWASSKCTTDKTNTEGEQTQETGQQITVTNPRARALHQNAIECIVSDARRLSSPDAAAKHHIEIQLPEDMKYSPGDHLSILPINPPQNVRRALARFHLARDSVLLVSRISHKAASTQESLSASDVFGHYVELAQPATRRNISTLISATPEGEDRDKLIQFGGDLFESHIRNRRVSVLDLLEKSQSTKLSIGAFIDMLPPLRVRTYSISSSAAWKPRQASLTVSVVQAPALSGQGTFHGVASNFLSDLVPGDAVHITIRACKTQFRAPTDAAEYPIIMIGAGSGIAPFRGFLQDRVVQKRNGVKLQPALLFFGCRDPEQDDLYRDELDPMESDGIVSVRRAFSASKNGLETKKYVQDRLWDDREDVLKLWRRGARVYVCGGTGMTQMVRSTFTEIVRCEEEGGIEKEKKSEDEIFDEFIAKRYETETFAQT